jgi:hypothetical protein
MVVVWMCLVPPGMASLKVDFGLDTGPVAPGFEGYTAQHERPATFTAQSFAAFGTTVIITPIWSDGASAAAMQMIDRQANAYPGDRVELLQDWIGTDGRQTGDPLTLVLSGLPSGAYAWRSYHHDNDDQTGVFEATITDAAGQTRIPDIDISHANPRNGDPGVVLDFDHVTRLEAVLVSNGTDDVTVQFDHTSADSPVSLAFFVMNGLELEALNPCLNVAPVIEGPAVRSALLQEPSVLEVTVTDDGLPYQEGCSPDAPEVGTPWGLRYRWQQVDGPVLPALDPARLEEKDLAVTFPVEGAYQWELRVTDGPVAEDPEAGKESRYTVTVVVHDGSGPSSVVISEFLASNQGGLQDANRETPDWIELLNTDTVTVALDNWSLTDDPENLTKWAFPAGTTIPPGAYLVVFASGASPEHGVDTEGNLHTNFKLSAGGEYLALVRPDGTVAQAFAPAYPRQESNLSYGLWEALEMYFAQPTPGAANTQPFPGFVGPVEVSHERGFYDRAFELQLYCEDPEAEIWYTLDGSAPVPDQGRGRATRYVPGTSIPITTTALVRAQALRSGWHALPTVAHSYLFLDDVVHQPAHPQGWPGDWGFSTDAGAVVPADYEMDPRVVDQTLPGYSVREALLAIPSMSVAMEPDDFISTARGIYANPQSRWERPCSVEYILPPGHPAWQEGPGFQHNCKIEVHGNASRRPFRMQKHSLRLTFSGDHGPATLRYPLFVDTEVEAFNQLVLRACFTDSWGLVSWGSSRYRPNDSQYLRDIWMKDSLRDMGQPSSHGHFVHLYVNGLYFGLHNLTERVREEFFASHLGGRPEDWEVNVDLSQPGPRWREMMALDLSTEAGYREMQRYLDLDNFADYMLLHFFADAEDWPHHNGYAAANAVSGDGRFRFWVWDQEIVLDYHGRAGQRIDSNSGAGALFQKLRGSAEFRLLFADRVYRHCFNTGALTLAATRARYRSLADAIDQAIVAESARWGDTQRSTPYGNSIEQPSPLTDVDHLHYPPAPHGPDYYFTREDAWVLERDNILNNYLPAIHDTNNGYALLNLLRAKNLYPPIDPPVFQVDGGTQHGGTVAAGAQLTLFNPNEAGTVYYTLDGTDPRRPIDGAAIRTEILVAEEALKRILVPTQAIDDSWRTTEQPGWVQGTGSVSYERGSGYEDWIGIDVESSMYQRQTSCYVTIPFTCPKDPGTFDRLTLSVRYDDGFVAILNGIEVARAFVEGTPQWNAAASGSHEASGLETFDITDHLSSLQRGENVLAIQGMNISADSSDFIVGAALAGSSLPADSTPFSPGAQAYNGPMDLSPGTTVKARCLDGLTWSALAEAEF